MRFWPLILLSACAAGATPQMGTSPGTELVDDANLPMPSRSDVVAASRPYLIGPFDKLNIDVFGVEELAREVQIDASGRLSFPLIGVVEAAGLTPGELATAIETRLAGLENVVVFRTVDGQRYAGLYNLKAIRQGNYEDPQMYANDVIVVSESTARRLFRDFLTAAPLLTTPIIALTR